MTTTILEPKHWTKIRAGHYGAVIVVNSLVVAKFEIWYEEETKLWYCTRNNGPVFDCASTLSEAKTLCREEVNQEPEVIGTVE